MECILSRFEDALDKSDGQIDQFYNYIKNLNKVILVLNITEPEIFTRLIMAVILWGNKVT